MKKLTLTILHKLPNRVRFHLSHRISDIKNFHKTLKVGKSIHSLRYNYRTNTLLVEFNPEKIFLQEVIYNVVTALSIENGMMPVRLVEEFETKSLNSLSLYSGASIFLAFLNNLTQKKETSLQKNMNNLALALTTTSIAEHAYTETKKKGFFDIEILPALYILKSYFDTPSVTSIGLMWITTFGRHLITHRSKSKEIKVFRIKDKDAKYHYIADVHDDNTIENLSDLVQHIFFNQKKWEKRNEKYITITTK